MPLKPDAGRGIVAATGRHVCANGICMHYLAYGSNLHPLRLQRRTPSARLLGTVELPRWRLHFDKQGSDGSSKCTLCSDDDPHDLAHGAVFALDAAEVDLLDAAEGLGAGYDKHEMTVRLAGKPLPVFVYLASASHRIVDGSPYHWYRDLVLAGARHHGFPSAYLAQIARVASRGDPDSQRRRKMEALLASIAECARTGAHRQSADRR